MSNLSEIIQQNALPVSFHGDRVIYAINLAGLTTLTYIGAGFVYWMASAIITNRRWDRWNHPATLYRVAWLCAAISLTLRSGMEAAYLWAWNSSDPTTGTTILRVKWYVTAASFIFAWSWLTLNVLTYASIISQLRRQPLPVNVWTKLPALKRPAIISVLSIAMSIGVVWLRG